MSISNHPFLFDLNYSFGSDSVFVKIGEETKDLPPPPIPEGNLLQLQGTDFLLLDNTNFVLL